MKTRKKSYEINCTLVRKQVRSGGRRFCSGKQKQQRPCRMCGGCGLSGLEPLLHARALAVDAVAAGGSVAAVTGEAAAASVNVSLGAPSCSQTSFAQ